MKSITEIRTQFLQEMTIILVCFPLLEPSLKMMVMRIETSQNDKFCYLMLLCLAIIKSTQNFANSTNNARKHKCTKSISVFHRLLWTSSISLWKWKKLFDLDFDIVNALFVPYFFTLFEFYLATKMPKTKIHFESVRCIFINRYDRNVTK